MHKKRDEPAPTALRITLEIEPGATPLEGTLVVEGSSERRFSGWMELSNAIAAAQEGRASATEATRPASMNAG
jgi:hypothetical protein